MLPVKKEVSFLIGALGNGVAVCEGMAKAVKILYDSLNIWCIIALSYSDKIVVKTATEL